MQGIQGFRDPTDPAPTYSGRCRAVAAEVARHHAMMGNPFDPSGGDDALGWLETSLTRAVATPGTVADGLARSPPPASLPDDLLMLRTVAWLRLGRPADRLWEGGPESVGVWSLLMAPLPADDHELWWLATSHRVTVDQVRALIRRPPSDLVVAPPPAGRAAAGRRVRP